MPTANFDIASGTDDGRAFRQGTTYPPTTTFTAADGADLSIDTNLFSTQYQLYNSFMRWDTSSLAGNTVDSAILRLEVIDVQDLDGLSFAGDYYDFGGEPSVDGDMEATSDGSAFAPVTLASLSPGSKDFTLLNVSSINTAGFTGIRIAPASGTTAPINNHDNFVDFIGFESVGAEARLIVTYTAPSVGASLAWIRA